ncbi:hypothetical protein XENTR_v10020823 [Xenopus tropicalis]|uniref:Protein kinase C delta type-like n=1 Tax=Xenopus tropicalis TaxID=8364 RepID=A0A8J0T679_XENTR|nr:protein kinase C delta type-like [Xenopus tropicalis]KAE8584102.1 hypothetical protein XENTR_v10020823 [Xenopus tropicalis]
MRPKCFRKEDRGSELWKKMKRSREEDEEKSKSEQQRIIKKAKKSAENIEENKKIGEESRKERKEQVEKREIQRKRSRSPDNSAVGVVNAISSQQEKEAAAAAERDPVSQPQAVPHSTSTASGSTLSWEMVWLASWTSRQQRVAIKVIPKASQVETEARVLRIAKGSPFLCHAYGAFQSQNHAYIILEYIRGGTLMAGMRKAGHLEEDAIADLKPANIMLNHESHIKIVDFGLAKENISGNDTTTGQAGTPRYMAPEVIEGKEYNAAADWWSLGIIIYQMATYTFPFTSPMGKQLSPLTDEPFYPSWLSDELVDLLQALLEKDHHLRLGTTGKIREHPFFRCIDWVKLENRQLTPPFQLAVRSVENFRDSEGESPFFSGKKFLNKRNRVLEEFSFLDPDLQE